jgi:hypothetical protein
MKYQNRSDASDAVVAELIRQGCPGDDAGQLIEGEQRRFGQADAVAA